MLDCRLTGRDALPEDGGMVSILMDKHYAKTCHIVRAAFGLKQAELAGRLPITASQLSLVEAGKRQPSLRAVDALAHAVGMPTALVALLASAPRDVEAKSDEEMSDLVRAAEVPGLSAVGWCSVSFEAESSTARHCES